MRAFVGAGRAVAQVSTGEGKLPKFVLRRSFVTGAGAAVLALGVAVPAHAAGTTGPIKKLRTVNVRQAAAAAKPAQYRPTLRDLPAAKQFAALEERRNAGSALRKPAPALQPPTVAGQRIISNEVSTGFEGLDIRDTVFSQGFELEPPDQGLCGGTFGATTFLWEEVNLAIGLYDVQQNQYTPPALGLNVLYGVPPAVDADGSFGPFLSDPK